MTLSITLIIVIITGLISYRCFEDYNLHSNLAHYPYVESRNKEYHRFLTSGFVHGSWPHLLINLFVLYEFGRIVEMLFLHHFGDLKGRVFYLMLYVLGVIFANIATFIKHKDDQAFRSVGASGAVSAVLFAYVIFAPWSKLYLYFVIPIYSIIGALLYIGYSTYASKQSGGKIDHLAHLYGAIFGFLFTIALKPSLFSEFLNRLINNVPF